MTMRLAPPLFALTLLAACQNGTPPNDLGRASYEEVLADGNTFTCSTCHAIREPEADGLTRPGHPLGDATRRPTYKDGSLTEMRDAVNTCVTQWMNGDPWSASDPRWTALHAYLDGFATAPTAPAVDIQITPPPDDLTGGDPSVGRTLFNGRCIVCHGADAVGTERAPALLGNALEAEYVARRVRTSGRMDSTTYPGLTGGIMPFWGADRLSDDQLRDIIAYVVMRSTAEPTADAGMGDAGVPTDAGPSGCPSSHPSVGQTASLSTNSHGTTGTARIVDDCTIVVEGFSYDGGGIDVRFYGGTAGNYTRGFPISDDLLRAGGYDGESLMLRLPLGRTLDDLDGISLWCVAAGVSFGDGIFM